jgi:hypothetical protein
MRHVSLNRLFFALQALATVLYLFSFEVQKADNTGCAKS